MTLVEVMVALVLIILVMAALTSQMIESLSLTIRTARNLEYARNSRFLIDQMAADMRDAQAVTIFPSFTSRTAPVGDGESGNYVVLQSLDSDGAIIRTVGYYLVADGSGTVFTLYRHDSNDGGSPDVLPATGTSGTHRRVVRTVRLVSGDALFRNFRNRGFSLRAEFGNAERAPSGRLELIQCTLTTRS